MNEDENEELDKNEIAPDLNDGFGSYEDFDITSDDNDEENEEKSEEEASEEELAQQIEEQVKGQVENQAKQAAKESIKKGAKTAGKATGKAMLTAVKFLFTPPILYITLAVLAVVLILALILIVVSALGGAGAAPYENIDPANGKFATSIGITGDKFYGARAIYLDPEQSQIDLKDYYYAFSEDFLTEVDAMPSVDIKLNVDLVNLNNTLSKIVAKEVSGSTEDLTLEEYIALIDHFGYTNKELDAIQNKFVSYLVANQTTLLTINDGYTTLENDLNTLYDKLFIAYNVTSPLYYVKDIILENNEESMIPSLEAENYVALIYMPRTNVIMQNTSFMFYFPEENTDGYATTINFEFITYTNSEENVLYTATADSSWWQDGAADQLAEVENINFSLQKFNSINLEIPILDVNIYSLLFDNNGNASTHNVKKYCTANLIEDSENGLNYYEISYLPHNDGIYMYLRLNGDGKYQFCEFKTEFEAVEDVA